MKLSRKPRRKGPGRTIYCAPFCGYGCTWAAYQKANELAGLLADALGAGWKPHVWENLGWHWSVYRGGLKIYPSINKGKIVGYTAFLGEAGELAGGKWAEHGKTPRAAIKNVMKVAQKEVDWITGLVEAAKE